MSTFFILIAKLLLGFLWITAFLVTTIICLPLLAIALLKIDKWLDNYIKTVRPSQNEEIFWA